MIKKYVHETVKVTLTTKEWGYIDCKVIMKGSELYATYSFDKKSTIEVVTVRMGKDVVDIPLGTVMNDGDVFSTKLQVDATMTRG